MIQQCLPRNIEQVIVPPIKCQGIKTKLVKFILSNIRWEGRGRWIEPFLGSGVVLFNVQPDYALVNDINPHVIKLYQMIYDGEITGKDVDSYLTTEGRKLLVQGEDYYYLVRERFNKEGNPLDFLFLNRSCFNGVMRFNKKGEFNVPFCQRRHRFQHSYVTKIVNQVLQIKSVMRNKCWEFRVGDWREILRDVGRDDFVYLDPPYIGRYADYYQQWSEKDGIDLAKASLSLPSGFALSMWKEDQHCYNVHIDYYWKGLVEKDFKHFYHVGPTKAFRYPMIEALLIKPGYAVDVSLYGDE